MPGGRNITDTLVIPDQCFSDYGFIEIIKYSVKDSMRKTITPKKTPERRQTNRTALFNNFSNVQNADLYVCGMKKQ